MAMGAPPPAHPPDLYANPPSDIVDNGQTIAIRHAFSHVKRSVIYGALKPSTAKGGGYKIQAQNCPDGTTYENPIDVAVAYAKWECKHDHAGNWTLANEAARKTQTNAKTAAEKSAANLKPLQPPTPTHATPQPLSTRSQRGSGAPVGSRVARQLPLMGAVAAARKKALPYNVHYESMALKKKQMTKEAHRQVVRIQAQERELEKRKKLLIRQLQLSRGQPPTAPQNGASESAVAERAAAVAARQTAVEVREQEQDSREAALFLREEALSSREDAVAEREHTVAERKHAVAEREHAVAEREHTAAPRAAVADVTDALGGAAVDEVEEFDIECKLSSGSDVFIFRITGVVCGEGYFGCVREAKWVGDPLDQRWAFKYYSGEAGNLELSDERKAYERLGTHTHAKCAATPRVRASAHPLPKPAHVARPPCPAMTAW